MSIQFNINNIFESIGSVTYDTLLDYFRMNYNQKIFVKKISENLVLIYNSFDIKLSSNNDPNLYNECRSLVVEVGDNPKVISYTHDNIEYLKVSEYSVYENPLNTFEESYEGTLISVFNHNNEWYFTTSRCGSIDLSYYYNKTRTFGNLFDECLNSMGIENRSKFTEYLDTNICYYFVLVHHENKYIIDYTSKFGENYKKLVNVFNRNKLTQEIVNSDLVSNLNEIVIPRNFESFQIGVDYIINNTNTEGMIVKIFNQETKKTILLKIHSDNYWLAKLHNPNYPNRWFAYLYVFKKNDPTFTISNYQSEKNIIENVEINGKQVDITGMIHLLYKGCSEILFDVIMHFTQFNYISNNFVKINSQDYENLKNIKYAVLRKQLSVLQGLILKKKITSSVDIIRHLRKYVSVEDFIGLLSCLNNLIKETDNAYIKHVNKNYLSFSQVYLDNIKN
jgi:hypothetical protein